MLNPPRLFADEGGTVAADAAKRVLILEDVGSEHDFYLRKY